MKKYKILGFTVWRYERTPASTHITLLKIFHIRYRHQFLLNTDQFQKKVLSKNGKLRLLFDHSLGGGTEVYTNDYLSKIKDSILCLRAQYIFQEQKYSLKMNSPKHEFQMIEKSWVPFLCLLKKFAFDEIIVNNLAGYPDPLTLLEGVKEIKNPRTKVSFRGHDFYAICPSTFLLNDRNTFCNLPEHEICIHCYHSLVKEDLNIIPLSRTSDINLWRKKWKLFFQETLDEMIVFSESGKELFLKAFPLLANKIKVVPHTILPLKKVVISRHEEINIVVLGNILRVHKGCDIINQMACLLQDRVDVRIIIIGNLKTTGYPITIKCSGSYQRAELPALVEKEMADIIFIPSICPETFSYTAAEGMSMGLPVACFNIGAPAERIIKYDKGLVINKIDAEYALNAIIHFIQEKRNGNSCYHSKHENTGQPY
ncbi:MAG: glycosyltransferase family 4 protein [bacterium]